MSAKPAWSTKWAGGRTRINRLGDRVWVIEKMVDRRQFSITTKAVNEEEAIAALRMFEVEHGLRPTARREYAIPAQRIREGVVYFIRCGGAIKIGFTSDIEKRVASLRSGHVTGFDVIGFIPGTMSTERSLHAKFAHLRINGEWFAATKDLTDAIALALADLANGPGVALEAAS